MDEEEDLAKDMLEQVSCFQGRLKMMSAKEHILLLFFTNGISLAAAQMSLKEWLMIYGRYEYSFGMQSCSNGIFPTGPDSQHAVLLFAMEFLCGF